MSPTPDSPRTTRDTGLEGQQDNSDPDPNGPSQNEAGAGQPIKGLEGRFPGGDGVSAQGFLDRYFSDTTGDNDPQCHETHFGSENRGYNEFTRTHEGGR
jgi:hypothetical protein